MDTVYVVLVGYYDQVLDSVWTTAKAAIKHAKSLHGEVMVDAFQTNHAGFDNTERIYHRDRIPTAEELERREQDARQRENERVQAEFERQVALGVDVATAIQRAEQTRDPDA